jgi:hypothetical protein
MSVDALSDLMPGSSPFHYCFNNPLILRDPSGLIGEIGGDGIPRFTTGEVVVYGERDNSSEEVIRDRKLEWMAKRAAAAAADMARRAQGGGVQPAEYEVDKHWIGPALVGLGQPIKYLKPVGALGSKPGSSIASRTLSKVIPYTFTSILGKQVGAGIVNVVGTNVIGRAIGRVVPYLGWGMIARDVWCHREAISVLCNDMQRFNQQMSYSDDGTWNTEWHVR